MSDTMRTMLAHIGTAVWVAAAIKPRVLFDLSAPIGTALSSGDRGEARAALLLEEREEAGDCRV